MTTCSFCGFTSKSRAVFVTMENDRIRCKSGTACQTRLRSGKCLKAPVRLKLESSPIHTAEEESARVTREIRHAYYRHGLCVDCGVLPYSPGRPRCEACHAKRSKA